MKLSERDSRAVADALLGDPEPNEALRRAAAAHDEMRTEENTYPHRALCHFGIRPAAPEHERYCVPLWRRWVVWWRMTQNDLE